MRRAHEEVIERRISVDEARDRDVMRRRFFAEARETASRYGVAFDRVMQHMDDLTADRSSSSSSSSPSLSSARHLADLSLVVACVDGTTDAWLDLALLHERGLTRRLASLIGEHDALVLTRRWLVDLRRRTNDGLAGGLGEYHGEQSLRHWLGRRLVGHVRLDRIATDQDGRSIRHWTVRTPLPTGAVNHMVPVSGCPARTDGSVGPDISDDRILAFPR